MTIREAAKQWARVGLGLVYPPECAYCNSDVGVAHDGSLQLCALCQSSLVPAEWLCCPRCGIPSRGEAGPSNVCAACRDSEFAFDAVVSLGAYRGPLREAVLRMKRPAHEPLSIAMGRLYFINRGVQLASFRPDLIVPIPMFWWRRFVRQTNSPDILARELARLANVRRFTGALRRCRNTLPQRILLPRERFHNVRAPSGWLPVSIFATLG